jgi:Fe-S-cluster-containing hydrogenase component 2
LDHCPQDAIDLTKNPPVIHNFCEGEGICYRVCPNNAIEVLNMAEIGLKKSWWYKSTFESLRTPTMSWKMDGKSSDLPPITNPRFRNLVRKEDEENSYSTLYFTSYPRFKIKDDLWPEHMDDKS